MPQTSATKKAHLKNLTKRLDFLERWFRDFGAPNRMTAELLKETLDEIGQTRKAVAEKRFEAVLLYHDLENWHRFLVEHELEIPKMLSQTKRDARDFEGRWKGGLNSAKVRRDNSKKKDCLAYIALRLREDPTIEDDFKRRTQLNKDAAKTYDVDVHEVRRWRREDAAQKIEEMNRA